jgi:NhaP-type Na+/H+ or K+/H+ antiporter
VVRISVTRTTPLKDAAFMAVMIPKGLGAAVLASLPFQKGIEGGEIIQSVVFSIILCTTFLTTILSFLVDKTFISVIYCWIYKMLGLGKSRVAATTEPEADAE